MMPYRTALCGSAAAAGESRRDYKPPRGQGSPFPAFCLCPSIPKRPWPASRNVDWVCHTLPPPTLHLPSAFTPQAKDCFPCPCTATIGEEAGNAPSGVAFACSASCTSFEKSSLLSSRVPLPTHDMASLSVNLGSLRPSYSTFNAGSKRNRRSLSRHC